MSLSMKSSISAYPCIDSAQSTGLDLHHDIVLCYFREDDLLVKEGWQESRVEGADSF